MNIREIYIRDPIPVSHHDTMVPHQVDEQLVWLRKKRIDGDRVWPGATARREACMRVHCVLDEKPKKRKCYVLEGSYAGAFILLLSKPTWSARKDIDFIIDLVPCPKALVAIDGQPILWTLVEYQDDDQVTASRTQAVTTVLDVFWLTLATAASDWPHPLQEILAARNHDSDPDSNIESEVVKRLFLLLFPKGIPIALLRDVTQALSASPGSPLTVDARGVVSFRGHRGPDWARRAIVEWVFHRNPPRYDVWHGDSYFLDFCHVSPIPHGTYYKFDGCTLLFGEYLAAIDDPQALCNCYDMAGVVQVYLRMIGIFHAFFGYAATFGFLKLTHLVGRGCTNNPMWANAATSRGSEGEVGPIVPYLDPGRTSFGNHAFVVASKIGGPPLIMDATAGPHPGNVSVGEYLSIVVENQESRLGVRRDVLNTIGILADVGANISLHSGVIRVNELTPFDEHEGDYRVANVELAKQASRCINTGLGGIVPRRWATLLELVPDLAGDRWRLVRDQLYSSHQEVLRTWRWRSPRDHAINLDIFVASGRFATSGAARRLLRLLDTETAVELRFQEHTGWFDAPPERPVAVLYRPGRNEIVWSRSPVTFRLTVESPGIDTQSIVRAIDKQVTSSKKPPPPVLFQRTDTTIRDREDWAMVVRADPPPLENDPEDPIRQALREVVSRIVCATHEKRVRCTIPDLGTESGNYRLDFHRSHGLVLCEQGERFLDFAFTGTAGEDASVLLSVIDTDSLLVETREERPAIPAPSKKKRSR